MRFKLLILESLIKTARFSFERLGRELQPGSAGYLSQPMEIRFCRVRPGYFPLSTPVVDIIAGI